MIILETNVLSGMMRAADEPAVEHWFDAQATESVWTTTVTINGVLGGRVLAFDRNAAEVAALLAASQRQIEIRDVRIAGIAAARKATLATRKTRHFEQLGVPLIDPWRA